MKNISFAKSSLLKEEVSYLQGQVVSKTITQNDYMGLTLFAFDKHEEISTHQSKGDAFIYIIEGKARVTIQEEPYVLEEGQCIVMPANAPHAVYALEQFKMLLIVDFLRK